MKTDKPGTVVQFKYGNNSIKTINVLDDKWRRYSFTLDGPGQNFTVLMADKNATVWIDAMQMEKGNVPSKFSP